MNSNNPKTMYSSKSLEKLASVDPELRLVFMLAGRYFDNTIICGQRTEEEQMELYKKGRELINGEWKITDRNKVVTNVDGKNKKSYHNSTPSKAVDALPYPIDWNDRDSHIHFAGFIKGIAKCLKHYGIIKNDVTWGGDWDDDNDMKDTRFWDAPHFQIEK